MDRLTPPDDDARADARSGVVALVLAAGHGERFEGEHKLLADLAGRPLVAHAVASAHAAEVDRVVVVVGHDGDRVAAAAGRGGDVEVVVNPHHAAGQSTSLRAGIDAIEVDASAQVVVVLLADQPGVSPAAVRTVAAAVREGPACARASYVDGPGHPVAFARSAWAQLRAVSGDAGARHLLEDLEVSHVLVAGHVPDDVDTVADLERLRRTFGNGTAAGAADGAD